MSRFQSACVYCGSGMGEDARYRESAFAMGAFLARNGLRLVYGGAHVGLMGTVADGALSVGEEDRNRKSESRRLSHTLSPSSTGAARAPAPCVVMLRLPTHGPILQIIPVRP